MWNSRNAAAATTGAKAASDVAEIFDNPEIQLF
jgi:hypothetical protein